MAITNGYATLDEFKQRVGSTSTQAANKAGLIEREIERNSRQIDRITGDKFYSVTLTTTRVNFDMGVNADGLVMSEDAKRIYFPGTITITSITSDGAALVVDEDYVIGQGFIEATNIFTTNRKTGVVITGTCGYTSVPDDVNEICLAMTEVSTGLGTYTVIDEAGNRTEITRSSMPSWVNDKLFLRKRFFSYG
jgi:hypothetical protein